MPQFNWPLVTSWPGLNSWPIGNQFPGGFPSSLTPIAWFDARQKAFSDTAGATPAVIGGPVGRLLEPSPLSSYWTATDFPTRDTATTVRFNYFGTAIPNMTQPGVPALNNNNCAFAVTFRARDGGPGPSEGLLVCTTPGVGLGLYAGGGTLSVTYAGTNWSPVVPHFSAGDRVTFVASFTSTGISAWVVINGATSTDSTVTAIASAAANTPLVVGDANGARQGIDGSVSQALAFASSLASSDGLALAAWLDAQSVPTAFPTTAPLVAVCGDSIARNIPGAVINHAWCWLALGNMRAGSFPSLEMVNAAASGAGSAGVINNALPYYSSSRYRNVMPIAVGTNDLATGSTGSATLTTILGQYDSALALGWLPIIATVLDRTGALSVSQATFNAERATLNAGILASGRSVIDMTGTAGVSAVGASTGANFVGDGVHPNDAGHALMEPIYRAAILARLA